ncbi:hypothetical protein KFL_015400010 [Klebsormidium nitens]|uniref:Uncharacterized protein n=1 Tax=Klebsormidium nitens TaxID=105231 RepID=A0A1Y1IRG0_KLENI|nr:hypothetical protein KFL_015400010 [Klebsormidium nitens]|eukprot:GAQ93450.1 hypothetical protein KFL_015400010 [Klebsormidium nitens]
MRASGAGTEGLPQTEDAVSALAERLEAWRISLSAASKALDQEWGVAPSNCGLVSAPTAGKERNVDEERHAAEGGERRHVVDLISLSLENLELVALQEPIQSLCSCLCLIQEIRDRRLPFCFLFVLLLSFVSDPTIWRDGICLEFEFCTPVEVMLSSREEVRPCGPIRPFLERGGLRDEISACTHPESAGPSFLAAAGDFDGPATAASALGKLASPRALETPQPQLRGTPVERYVPSAARSATASVPHPAAQSPRSNTSDRGQSDGDSRHSNSDAVEGARTSDIVPLKLGRVCTKMALQVQTTWTWMREQSPTTQCRRPVEIHLVGD